MKLRKLVTGTSLKMPRQFRFQFAWTERDEAWQRYATVLILWEIPFLVTQTNFVEIKYSYWTRPTLSSTSIGSFDRIRWFYIVIYFRRDMIKTFHRKWNDKYGKRCVANGIVADSLWRHLIITLVYPLKGNLHELPPPPWTAIHTHTHTSPMSLLPSSTISLTIDWWKEATDSKPKMWFIQLNNLSHIIGMRYGMQSCTRHVNQSHVHYRIIIFNCKVIIRCECVCLTND